MRYFTLLVCFIVSLVTIAQDITYTIYDRTPDFSSRRLNISGTFIGADTVYIQVYHEGNEITSDVAIMTFSITLGEFTTYLIKFTDSNHRVKTVAIHELGDGLIEFYPPLEIDFNRVGNLLLIKPSARKPYYIEYDVGMGRSKVGQNNE